MQLPPSRRRARAVVALASALFVVLGPAAPAAAQQESASLTVVARAADTGAPVAGVQVVLPAAGLGGVTAADGTLRLASVTPGTHTVIARRLGYATQTHVVHFLAGQTTSVALELAVEAIPLAEVRVRARPSERTSFTERRLTSVGFYRRQARSPGTFITRSEIERRDPYRLSDMLRNVPGMRLSPMSAGGDAYATMGRSALPGRRCPILYYVDGTPARGYNIDDMPARDVEALEIYHGPAQVPPEFDRRSATCGLIVIWTRSGDQS